MSLRGDCSTAGCLSIVVLSEMATKFELLEERLESLEGKYQVANRKLEKYEPKEPAQSDSNQEQEEGVKLNADQQRKKDPSKADKEKVNEVEEEMEEDKEDNQDDKNEVDEDEMDTNKEDKDEENKDKVGKDKEDKDKDKDEMGQDEDDDDDDDDIQVVFESLIPETREFNEARIKKEKMEKETGISSKSGTDRLQLENSASKKRPLPNAKNPQGLDNHVDKSKRSSKYNKRSKGSSAFLSRMKQKVRPESPNSDRTVALYVRKVENPRGRKRGSYKKLCKGSKQKHTCTFCNKNFRSFSTLNVHTRIHTGEKPYKCQFCPMEFNQKGNTKRHTESHLYYSQLSRNSMQMLNTHHPHCNTKSNSIRTVSTRSNPISESKPKFICRICNRGFNYSFSLYKHVRIHYTYSEEASYTCPDTKCRKTFNQTSSLNLHIRYHH